MTKVRVQDMTLNLPHIQRIPKGAKTYYYFRKPGQKRVRVHPDRPGFLEHYASLVNDPDVRAEPKKGSIDALFAKWLASREFKALSPSSKKSYRTYSDLIRGKVGHLPARGMETKDVYALRDTYSETPRKADYIVATISVAYEWGRRRGLVKLNPAERVKNLHKAEGYQPWEEAEIKAFQSVWPLGTLERTAFELCLWTGQRGGDVIKMQRQHISGGFISVAQQKTGARVNIPVSGPLQKVLDAWFETHTHMVLLTTPTGRPVKVDYFRKMMRGAYEKAAIDKNTHGLRYTAARRLFEAGVDLETIGDITGHTTMEMVRKYAMKKRQTKLGMDEVEKLDRNK